MAPVAMFVGTYTAHKGIPGAQSEGIYRCEFDAASGNLSDAVLAVPSQLSPSWLRWHPVLPVLYSTQETNEGSASALVSYRLTDSGDLVETARVSTCGGSACHFSIHPSLSAIACANHGNYQDDVGSGNMSGSVAVVSICKETGDLLQLVDFMPHLNETSATIRADSRRLIYNEESHAHSANFDPSGRFLLVGEKGLDKIIVYRFDTTALEADDVSLHSGQILRWNSDMLVTPGGGARHLAWHPSGKFCYVNEESGGVITSYAWDVATGTLRPIQSLPTGPEGFQGSVASAEIAVGPTGHLYVANRGPQTVATFALAVDGTMELRGHSPTSSNPRHIQFTSAEDGGHWMVASSGEDKVIVFKLDDNGVPQPAGDHLSATCPDAAHMLFAKSDLARL